MLFLLLQTSTLRDASLVQTLGCVKSARLPAEIFVSVLVKTRVCLSVGVSCHSKRFCFCPVRVRVRALISRVADRPTERTDATTHILSLNTRGGTQSGIISGSRCALAYNGSFWGQKWRLNYRSHFPLHGYAKKVRGSPPLKPLLLDYVGASYINPL